MSGTLKVGGKTIATHDTNTNVAKIQLGSTSDVVLTDSAGTNVLSESGGVVTLTADEANVGSNALVVNSSGNVGVGTSPSTKLDISDTSRLTVNVANAYVLETSLNSAGSYFASHYENASDHIFQTSGTERMRIDSSGNLGLANSNNIARIKSQYSISLADDGSISVTTLCGASIVCAYDQYNGEGIACFVTFASTAIVVGQSAGTANSDTDNKLCIFKNANSHTTTVKNRLGGTKNFNISVIGSSSD